MKPTPLTFYDAEGRPITRVWRTDSGRLVTPELLQQMRERARTFDPTSATLQRHPNPNYVGPAQAGAAQRKRQREHQARPHPHRH